MPQISCHFLPNWRSYFSTIDLQVKAADTAGQFSTRKLAPLFSLVICSTVCRKQNTDFSLLLHFTSFHFHLFILQMECQNYIRVLLVNKTEVMTCGTNAFQPLCITREVESGNNLYEIIDFTFSSLLFLLRFRCLSSHLCFSFKVGNISRVLERVNGVARCPYDPRHNSTAVVTESGELYAATVIDFSGRDPVIYRSLGGMPPLRTAQYNSKWLNGNTTQH